MPDSIASLVRRLENGDLDPAAFRHDDHVRVAWALLQHHDFFEALARLRVGLKSLASRAGRPGAYHETITLAYLLLIHDRIVTRGRGATWDDFAAANPDLLVWPSPVLSRYYSQDLLESDLARRHFRWPEH